MKIVTTKKYMIYLDSVEHNIAEIAQSPLIEELGTINIDLNEAYQSRLFAFDDDAVSLLQRMIDFSYCKYRMVALKTKTPFVLKENSFEIAKDKVIFAHKYMIKAIRKYNKQLNKTISIKNNDRSRYGTINKSEIVENKQALLFSSYKKMKYYNQSDSFCYRFRLKDCKTKTDKVPLIIYLDGAGHPGYDNIKQLFGAMLINRGLAKGKHDCYILAPQLGSLEMYNTNTHSERLFEIVTAVARIKGNIDMNRIYLIGTSYGGYGVIYEAFRHPERYAAIIPTVAWMYLENVEPCTYFLYGTDKFHLPFTKENISTLATLPIWLAYSHVEASFIDPFYKLLVEAGAADVRLTREDRRGHGMSSLFFSNNPWAKWLFSQQINKKNKLLD